MALERPRPPDDIEAARKRFAERREQIMGGAQSGLHQVKDEQEQLRSEQTGSLARDISDLEKERAKSDKKLKDAGLK